MYRVIRRAVVVMALFGLASSVPALAGGGPLHALPAAASAPQVCSSEIDYTTITGPLLVTGYCELYSVTDNGSITLAPGAQLLLDGDTVVSGSITGTDGSVFLDDATVIGSITMKGTKAPTLPCSCSSVQFNKVGLKGLLDSNAVGVLDSEVGGAISVRNALFGVCFSITSSISLTNTYFQVGGNLDEGKNFLFPCGGILQSVTKNVICAPTNGSPPLCGVVNLLGSLSIANSIGEVEDNAIYGSVGISHSTVDFSSNEVVGSAQCSHDYRLADDDTFVNWVQGADTCESLPAPPAP